MVRYVESGAPAWVEPAGGPLIAVPEAGLPSWLGGDGPGADTDYDRACDVGGFAGLVPVGDAIALVLGDAPDATTFLPEHGLFVRWCAADSEEELLGGVEEAIGAAEWDPELRWDVPGPVVLFDALLPGSDLRRADHLRVALEPGRYGVRAAHVEPGPRTWLTLVQLRRIARE